MRVTGMAFVSIGVFMLLMDVLAVDSDGKAPVAIIFGLMLAAGIVLSYLGFFADLPTQELMLFAKSRGGLVTLSEIATEMEIDPHMALRTLKSLQKIGVARQRWQEIHRNVWEFPDYLEVPMSEALDVAQKNGGQVALKDLLAQGLSQETAQQALDVLREKGLAQQQTA
jgi:hypothetical protein